MPPVRQRADIRTAGGCSKPRYSPLAARLYMRRRTTGFRAARIAASVDGGIRAGVGNYAAGRAVSWTSRVPVQRPTRGRCHGEHRMPRRTPATKHHHQVHDHARPDIRWAAEDEMPWPSGRSADQVIGYRVASNQDERPSRGTCRRPQDLTSHGLPQIPAVRLSGDHFDLTRRAGRWRRTAAPEALDHAVSSYRRRTRSSHFVQDRALQQGSVSATSGLRRNRTARPPRQPSALARTSSRARWELEAAPATCKPASAAAEVGQAAGPGPSGASPGRARPPCRAAPSSLRAIAPCPSNQQAFA